MSKKIVIIGAGFGSLSAAALLAKEGFNIHVYEKNSQVGGRAQVIKENGFTFDMGPSWYMMPEVFEKWFAQFNTTPEKYYDLKKLSPSYKIFWKDNSSITIKDDLEYMKQEFEKIEPGSAEALDAYMKDSKKKYEFAINHILYKNADTVLDLFSKEFFKNAHLLRPTESAHDLISKHFKEDKIQQILEYLFVFLGCSPYNAPSLFSMLTHTDFNLGIWYPIGGFHSVVKAMKKVGESHGVTYHTNSPVDKIITQNSKATGIQVSGKTIKADIVVSNADYAFTESLIDSPELRQYSKEYWKNKTYVPSAFLLYLGIKGKLPKLKHHTLYFTDDWRKHFDQVFETPQWPVHPSIYISNPSKTDPTIAPKNHQAMMILVPVAAGLEENDTWKKTYGDYLIDQIEENMGIQLASKIVYRKEFGVKDFANTYNSYQGNALGGLAHTLFQSTVFRQSNRHKHIKNLYFSGANTNPGIGVPTAIISGHLVTDRILLEQ